MSYSTFFKDFNKTEYNWGLYFWCCYEYSIDTTSNEFPFAYITGMKQMYNEEKENYKYGAETAIFKKTACTLEMLQVMYQNLINAEVSFTAFTEEELASSDVYRSINDIEYTSETNWNSKYNENLGIYTYDEMLRINEIISYDINAKWLVFYTHKFLHENMYHAMRFIDVYDCDILAKVLLITFAINEDYTLFLKLDDSSTKHFKTLDELVNIILSIRPSYEKKVLYYYQMIRSKSGDIVA